MINLFLLVFACGSITEAPTSSVSVYPSYVDSEKMTNLGWKVQVDTLSFGMTDLTFHGSNTDQAKTTLSDWTSYLFPSAFAHPGHGEETAILGEMLGDFVWEKNSSLPIGEATLTIGAYSYVDFGISNHLSDPANMAFFMSGTATDQDENAIPFTVSIEAPMDRIIGQVPFDITLVESDQKSVLFSFYLVDPFEEGHLFDDIDFGAGLGGTATTLIIDPDEETAEYTLLHRRILSHDHYLFTYGEQ
jgi:hypothetical protein